MVQIMDFFVANQLHLSALVVLIAVLLFKLKRTRAWWDSIEMRRIRPLAERRDSFLNYAVVLSLIGFLSAFYHYSHPTSELGRLIFDFAALVMAVIGFFFTIYGIRGVLERPKDLDEVLVRTTAFLRKYAEKSDYTAVMLCEYPAWGALSRQQTNEYREFANSLIFFLEAGTNRKLVLVAPRDDQMRIRIGQYAKDYGRTAEESKYAQELNDKLVVALKALGDDAQGCFKRWRIEQAPRYQMLLIGEQVKGEKGLRLLEAIVWFAPRCSDMAQWEREEIGDRIKASVEVRAKLGKPLNAKAPFGYVFKDKMLVPHPEEAPIRKRMYELFLETGRIRTTARRLNEAGHRTREGYKFGYATVKRLLKNPTAKGIHLINHTRNMGKNKPYGVKPQSEWVQIPIEPIISRATSHNMRCLFVIFSQEGK